jgi:hypothetical protein
MAAEPDPDLLQVEHASLSSGSTGLARPVERSCPPSDQDACRWFARRRCRGLVNDRPEVSPDSHVAAWLLHPKMRTHPSDLQSLTR